MPAPNHPLRRSAARPTPRLYLVKACALLCVAFPLLALAAPARAGHWVLTTEGSGQAMIGSGGMLQTFTPPPPSTNSVTIKGIGAGASIGPCFGGQPQTITAKADLQVTVTGKWTNDTNSDNTAPPSVWLSESSTAHATCTNAGVDQPGSADDGWGDPVAKSGSQMGTSAPPSGPKYVPGGSFTATLTLSASASGTQGMFNGGGSAGASVGPITIAVHAQPYNMRLTPWTSGNGVPAPAIYSDNSTGTLYFHYSFSSTDGAIGDAVANTSMYETLDFSGNTSGTYVTLNGVLSYAYPSPPVNNVDSNGDTRVETVKQTLPFGSSNLASGQALDMLLPPPHGFTPAPYVGATWTVIQNYYFDDPATKETKVLIPGPDNKSPYTITRTVTPGTPPSTAVYSVSKTGGTATLNLP